jgi:hypothetical protein
MSGFTVINFSTKVLLHGRRQGVQGMRTTSFWEKSLKLTVKIGIFEQMTPLPNLGDTPEVMSSPNTAKR